MVEANRGIVANHKKVLRKFLSLASDRSTGFIPILILVMVVGMGRPFVVGSAWALEMRGGSHHVVISVGTGMPIIVTNVVMAYSWC